MSTIQPLKPAALRDYLDRITLISGAASHPNGEACVMQAVSYVAGEPWSDHPDCASPIITAFLIRWNDAMSDDDRQILKPYVPKIVGTRTTATDEETRAWMLTDWLARECVPAFLRLAGLIDHAELCEGLAPLMTIDAARTAQPHLDAAGVAARDAARDAAWDAAWDAARAALRPTIEALQASALLLLDRMIEVRS